MIVIDGLFKLEFVDCKLNVVIKIGVFELIKYVWLLDILVLKDLDLYKDKVWVILLIM